MLHHPLDAHRYPKPRARAAANAHWQRAAHTPITWFLAAVWFRFGNENLPGYVVLRPTNKIVVGPALWSNSFLPAQHQAASIITADMKVDKLVANVRNSNLTNKEQREQLDLLGRLNRLHLAKRNNDLELNAQIKAMETAYRMQFEAMDSFDIEKENPATRDKYGHTPFANSCLLARRLVESGVRYVGVYYVNNGNQPWDTHKKHNENHLKLMPRQRQGNRRINFRPQGAGAAGGHACNLGR